MPGIYTLSDPRTGTVMYVGKTIVSLKERLRCHLKDKYGCPRMDWIKTLAYFKLVPIIEFIEECPEEDLDWMENYWILQFRTWGFDLLNRTTGGEGGRLSEETKRKIGEKLARINTQQILELIELYKAKKYTQKEIGEMFGITRKAVEYHLKKNGIKIERFNKPPNEKQLAAMAKGRMKEAYTIQRSLNQSKALKGRVPGMIGKKHSPETKAKMRNSRLGYRKNKNLF